jgi:hypothetical protein
MNCIFCNAILNNVREREVYDHNEVLKKAQYGDCPYCKHFPGLHFVTICFYEGKPIKILMKITLFKDESKHDQLFSIDFFPETKATDIKIYCGKGAWESVLQLQTDAIKPNNAKDKLLLYLTLS